VESQFLLSESSEDTTGFTPGGVSISSLEKLTKVLEDTTGFTPGGVSMSSLEKPTKVLEDTTGFTPGGVSISSLKTHQSSLNFFATTNPRSSRAA